MTRIRVERIVRRRWRKKWKIRMWWLHQNLKKIGVWESQHGCLYWAEGSGSTASPVHSACPIATPPIVLWPNGGTGPRPSCHLEGRIFGSRPSCHQVGMSCGIVSKLALPSTPYPFGQGPKAKGGGYGWYNSFTTTFARAFMRFDAGVDGRWSEGVILGLRIRLNPPTPTSECQLRGDIPVR